jgi:hypothetical protein
MKDARLDRIEDKLDHVIELVGGLPDLQRRATIHEAAMVPIQSHVAMVQGALKLLAILLSVVGVAAGIAKAFR